MGDKVLEKVNIKVQERISKKAESYLQSDLVKKKYFIWNIYALFLLLKKYLS